MKEILCGFAASFALGRGSALAALTGPGHENGALDQQGLLRHIAANRKEPMSTVDRPLGRRINWTNVITVLSAAVLIGAEVFGAAFAGGWALSGLLGLGEYGVYVLQTVFFVAGLLVMASFVRAARRIEPFTSR